MKELRLEEPHNSFYFRAVGSILHDFYCGVERIYERIAEELNGGIPEGDSWHIQLLKDMKFSKEIAGFTSRPSPGFAQIEVSC